MSGLPALPANLPSIAKANAADVYRLHAQEGRCPEAPGVYAFWEGDVCRYVGESRNIRKRLATHDRSWPLRDCRVRWLACDDHKAVESWLIEALKPTDNGKDPYWRTREAERAKNEHLQAAYLIPRGGQEVLVAVGDLTDEEIRAKIDDYDRALVWIAHQAEALLRYKATRHDRTGAA